MRTEPDTFALVQDFGGPVRFHFDERISERVEGPLDDIVIVSPVTGELQVSLGRGSVTVDVEGGFRADKVYRVTLLPAVRDMFGNQLRDPFELVFSTGASFSPTVVAGLVWDRISGDGVEPAEVRAITESADSSVFLAKTDTGGVYALRYLPRGTYTLVAFQDRNADGVVDPMETLGTQRTIVESPSDTVFLAIPTLVRDTTAARLTSAEILDSVTVVVELDDYLDPAAPIDAVEASLASDSGAVPAVRQILLESGYAAWVEDVTDSLVRLDSLDALVRDTEAAQAAEAAALETQERDTLAAPDSTGAAVPDSATAVLAVPGGPEEVPSRSPPPTLSGTAGGRDARPRPDGSDPPVRRIVLLLEEGLVRGWTYELTLTGVVNINDVPEGGGRADLLLEVIADTVTVDPDSMTVPDTLGVPPDTGAVALRLPRVLRERLPR